MWIFMSESFLSVVEHDADDNLLLVRARFEGDIDRVFPEADVAETPTSDYRYRAALPRERVAEAIAGRVRKIHYPNFKDSRV
jgi:hypothetical protein